MTQTRKFNWILLFMALVVLAMTATVFFVTHSGEERQTHFWVTFAFLAFAIIATFALAALQNSLKLDGQDLPLPLFMGLASILLIYDLFVVAAPILLWKGLALEATTYILVQVLGLGILFVLGGSALMTVLASTTRAIKGQGEIATFALRAEEAHELARKAQAAGDASLAEVWEEVAEALCYADPLGTEESTSLERSIDEALAHALSLTANDEDAEKTSRLLAQSLSENLLRRKALLLRSK